MKVRVHELAADLRVESKTLMGMLKNYGYDAKSPSHALHLEPVEYGTLRAVLAIALDPSQRSTNI